jgi:hypothetical protein
VSTERELLRLERGAVTVLVTTARVILEDHAGHREEVQLADITDVVVGAAAAGAGAGYTVRVQHWRPGPALVVELDDEGEARRLAQAIVAAARAAP